MNAGEPAKVWPPLTCEQCTDQVDEVARGLLQSINAGKFGSRLAGKNPVF